MLLPNMAKLFNKQRTRSHTLINKCAHEKKRAIIKDDYNYDNQLLSQQDRVPLD